MKPRITNPLNQFFVLTVAAPIGAKCITSPAKTWQEITTVGKIGGGSETQWIQLASF